MILTKDRNNLNETKKEFAVSKHYASLKDALKGADGFLGLSKADLISGEDIKEMNENPLIFALSNPIPEIMPDVAKAARPDAIVATGRSDFPNQINNVLGFPFIFKGALSVRASKINEEMKMAAAQAIANLARKPITSKMQKLLGHSVSFGREYLLPSVFDERLSEIIPSAVAKAAIDSGVARV